MPVKCCRLFAPRMFGFRNKNVWHTASLLTLEPMFAISVLQGFPRGGLASCMFWAARMNTPRVHTAEPNT